MVFYCVTTRCLPLAAEPLVHVASALSWEALPAELRPGARVAPGNRVVDSRWPYPKALAFFPRNFSIYYLPLVSRTLKWLTSFLTVWRRGVIDLFMRGHRRSHPEPLLGSLQLCPEPFLTTARFSFSFFSPITTISHCFRFPDCVFLMTDEQWVLSLNGNNVLLRFLTHVRNYSLHSFVSYWQI